LGSGVNGKVNALIVYKGSLVAAGEFTNAGGLDVNFIAQWDGTAWDDQLGGVGNTVTSLAVIGTDLFVGGYFTEADNTPVNYIAKRNSTGWHSLGGGMGGVGLSEKAVMGLTVYNGELYAGGFFTTAGGIPANHIAKWDGTSWSALGTGVGNVVYSLAGYNGNLVAGGLFISAGGNPANYIASWDGTSWSAMGSGMSGTFYQYVLTLTVYNNNLIAGGYFTHSDGLQTNGIAKWNGSAWSAMGGGFFYPANVYGAHTLCLYGSELIVGGLFSSAGGTGASHIASWTEPIVPVTLSIQDEIVPNGTTICYDATQTITVAGNGTSCFVQDGGMATMIAGQNIVYLPGTKVDSGGYLLGYITNAAQYCLSPFSPMSGFSVGKDNQLVSSAKPECKVYPNPSGGLFNVELTNLQKSQMVKMEVFNIHGKPVLSLELRDEKNHQLSLSDNPPGVYYVRLISSTGTETIKILRQQ
jgi:hypothetical protein